MIPGTYDAVQKMLTNPNFQSEISNIQADYLIKLLELSKRYGVALSTIVAIGHGPLTQMASALEKGEKENESILYKLQ